MTPGVLPAPSRIKSINLGGIKAKEGSKNISKAINLLPEEIEQLQQLVGKGVEVEIRQVPNDRKQLFAECV
jgi:fructoselysine and glucoselysine-specific PTS system IIB component